jgi:hypothetical protein
VVKGSLARSGHILQDMPLLLAQACHDGQQALGKLTTCATLGSKASLAPEHHRTQGAVKLSEGIAPSAGLQNRACRRVGGQRVTSVGTFPTAPLRTDRESFDLSQLASGHLAC